MSSMCANTRSWTWVGLVVLVRAHGERAVRSTDFVEVDALLLAEGADGLLADEHGLEHLLLGDLLGAGLEHADEVARAGELEVEVGVVAFLVGGVHEQLVGGAIAADAHAGERPLEGDATDRQRGAGAHGADDVDRVHLVGHEGGGDDLDLVAEAVGERRAQRAVDHAGRERALLGGTGLALEIAAGDATDGVHLLDEVDRQREEVVVLALLGHDDRHQRARVSLTYQAGPRGLLRELSRLEGIVLAVEVELVSNLCHVLSFPSHLRLPHCRRAII